MAGWLEQTNDIIINSCIEGKSRPVGQQDVFFSLAKLSFRMVVVVVVKRSRAQTDPSGLMHHSHIIDDIRSK